MSSNPLLDVTLDKVDFASLRAAGVDILQHLSGDRWTDYNLHDPGVTILEQLVYALTELDYAASFNVADLLSRPDADIDYPHLALHPPHEVFPCRPTTREDYRRKFLDVCPELDDVKFNPVGDDRPGLYYLSLIPAFELSETEETNVIRRAWETFHLWRNLGEDLAEPPCIERARWARLAAEIEVDSSRDPAELLAEIYSRAREEVASLARFGAFEIARQNGLTMEQTFTGPLFESGLWQGHKAVTAFGEPKATMIANTIAKTEGVRVIRSIAVNAETELPSDARFWHWSLRVPSKLNDIGVFLQTHGRPIRINEAAFNQAFDRIATQRIRIARTQQEPTSYFNLPTGQWRDFSAYSSVQNQFPAVYGLGQQRNKGSAVIPGTRPPNDAAIGDLRGYLVQFDQTMVDFLTQVSRLNVLFAANLEAQRTYWKETLTGKDVPGLGSVYPAEAADLLAKIERDFDAFLDRKGRAIDYLLALYGELPPRPPRQSESAIDTEDRAWLYARLAMLENVRAVGRDRAGGMNIATPDSAQGGCQRRLEALLGLGARTPKADPSRDGGCGEHDNAHGELFVIEHVLLRAPEPPTSPDQKRWEHQVTVVVAGSSGRNTEPQWREFVEMTVIETMPAHLLANVLWLDKSDMNTLVELHADWLGRARRRADDEPGDTGAAQRLSDFLADRLRHAVGTQS